MGLLGACGYFGSGSTHHLGLPHRAPKVQVAQPIDPAAQALAGMVEAVGPSGAQPPVELRFSIRNRPQVGQDDEVDYALIPQTGGLGTIRLGFGAIDGLQVVNHGPALAAIKPATGVPIFGSVNVPSRSKKIVFMPVAPGREASFLAISSHEAAFGRNGWARECT